MIDTSSLNLMMAYRYLVHVLDKGPYQFTESDRLMLSKIQGIADRKIREIDRAKLCVSKLCDDPAVVTPRLSMCGRCPAIDAAPDGNGHVCALNLRAVEDSAFNSVKAECLDRSKINPLGGSSGIN